MTSKLSCVLHNRELLPILFLIASPLVFFWRITLGQGVWFTTDIARLFYPFAVELTRALNQGHLPMWSSGMLAGFPLLAEGQVGALYPPNWLLYRLLPTATALSVGMLLHLAWAGCGMYAWTRAQGLRASSALLAGFVVAFNGTVFGQLTHPPVLAAMSWLPWLLFLQNRFARATEHSSARAAIWFFLTALVLGIQFLCGSILIAFLNTLAFGAIVLASEWFAGRTTPQLSTTRRVGRTVIPVVLVILLGAGIAAAQLVPTAELVDLSGRSGGTSADFALSYSLPLDFLPQFIFPFARGEPAETTIEYWGYLGLVPLVLAFVALALRRDRRTIFFGVFALVALTLALGESNPVYQWLARLPPFNFFRVPARYLYLVAFAAAFLAAIALDELAKRWDSPPRARTGMVLAVAVAIGAAFWLAQTQSIAGWLAAWQILPGLIGLAIILVWQLARFKLARPVLIDLLIGLTIIELVWYAPPFLATIDAITPVATVDVVPRSIEALRTEPMLWRVLTDESTFPSLPAMRGSLFPNTALIYGWQSALGFSSLAFRAHSAFLADLTPTMVNLLGVRYLMIPLEPRPLTKASTPSSGYAIDVLNNETIIPPTRSIAIELASYTEQATDLPDGTVVGELDVRAQDGGVTSFPIRLGIETGDWDYERKSATNSIQPARAPLAHSFPAFWRSFGRTFDGQTSLAHWSIPPTEIIGVNVRATQPDIRLSVENINLIDEQGNARSLATLTGKNNFALAFMSDTVAAWENRDMLPRAFMVHWAEIVSDDMAAERLRAANFSADHLVLLSEGKPMSDDATTNAQDHVTITRFEPERVELAVQTDRAGYLVLTDSWYPGWNASVDGQSTPIQRADVLFRAVPIAPGAHTVVFEYRPPSFVLGVTISIISFLVLAGSSIFYFRWMSNIQ